MIRLAFIRVESGLSSEPIATRDGAQVTSDAFARLNGGSLFAPGVSLNKAQG